MKDLFKLSDFIDIDILQEILDKFGEATGLAAVAVDYRGNPITRYSNFSRFCKLIRKETKCNEACHQSDARGGLEAARTGRPYIYKCHTGLVDFAVPIIVKGHYMGAIMAGQAKLEDEKEIFLENIVRNVPEWREKEEIMKAYSEITPMPYEKIVAAAHMLFVISNYTVEKGLISIIQDELNKKNYKLMEEMKTRIELEKALRDSELKALQSQINPHFLFNVLNTIGRLALIENADKTQEIVYSFAEMLRYTLKKNMEQMVSLWEEVQHIERYLKIQSVRLGNRLKYEIVVADEIKKTRIPFMTLQPFIENSINHGLDPKESGGKIRINGYSIEDKVIVKISDDGVGIPKDKLDIILNSEGKSNLNSISTGIGINNVRKRLVHRFGPMHDIQISSKPGRGTTVKISFPKRLDLRRVING
ncbi:PocR ligand-binding domain-containing protein [Wukongibacter baidiensis]|uniref:sensor histidine kinase n=1 Tax=Wukongibacter baidiensis TaxID=1723361 RepID=UPI003D7F80A3